MEPHLTRKLAGVLQPGCAAGRLARASACPSVSLHVVREGMWAVVNEPGGTAPLARLPDPRWQMAGKTGSSQVRRVSREQREQGNFDSSEAALGIPPARAVRRLRAVRRAALRAVGGGGARQRRRRGRRADRARHHDRRAAARPGEDATKPPGAQVAQREGAAMRDGRLWRETSFDLGAKVWQVNWLYVLLLCALAGVGYAALFSAAGGAPEPYAARHVLRFAFGLVLMVGIALVDIRFIARLAWPAYLVALVLLVLVLRMGHVGKGAQRWLDLGGLQMQPSELMKLALVLALASWFHRASWERIGNPLFLIPPVIAVLLPVGTDPEGAQPRHGGDHRDPGRGDVLRRRRAVVEVPAGGAAGAVRGGHRLRPPARLPARPDRHVPASRERSSRRRLQHHPVEDRAGLGRHVGEGFPARHAGPSRFPAGEADRLHLHHDRRGVRPRRRPGGDGAAGPDRAGRHG